MFRFWLENKADQFLWEEATKIANGIISAIENNSVDDNSQKYKVNGIEAFYDDRIFTKNKNGAYTKIPFSPYDYKYKFLMGEFLPDYPNLKLQFLNQAGIGKNKDLGNYGAGVIRVGIPFRTLNAQNLLKSPIKEDGRRFAFPKVIAKWLRKPDVYNTLLHEIIHYLDGKRTKGGIWKLKYDDEYENKNYYNLPHEYNAYLMTFIIEAKQKNLSLQNALEAMKKEFWYSKLNDNLKRKAQKRLALLWQ